MRQTPLARAVRNYQWETAEATGPGFYRRVLAKRKQAVGAQGRVLGTYAFDAQNVPLHRKIAAQYYLPPMEPGGMGEPLPVPKTVNQPRATATAETGESGFNWGGFLGTLFTPISEGVGRRIGGPRGPETVIAPRPRQETPTWVAPAVAAAVGIPLVLLLTRK